MQLQTSRFPALKYNSSNVPNVLSPHLWIGAFLLVWPDLLTPANELRIAVQAIGDEIHDVFLGSLIHKRLHRVASLEQTCIPISNVLQLRALKDQVPLIPQTMLTPGCRCADCVARVGSCVGLSQMAKCGNLGESAAAAGLCEDWQGARGLGAHTVAMRGGTSGYTYNMQRPPSDKCVNLNLNLLIGRIDVWTYRCMSVFIRA